MVPQFRTRIKKKHNGDVTIQLAGEYSIGMEPLALFQTFVLDKLFRLIYIIDIYQ